MRASRRLVSMTTLDVLHQVALLLALVVAKRAEEGGRLVTLESQVSLQIVIVTIDLATLDAKINLHRQVH